MKLTHLSIDNWQAIRHIDIAIERPILGLFGANEAGKSSVAEALKIAFTSEATRVDLKKEFGLMVFEGAKQAVISIATDQFEGTMSIAATGAVTSSLAGQDIPAALPYVLDAQRFASMAPDDRRRFLYGLMGVRITPEEIAKRLAAKGCAQKKVGDIAPLLRAGIEATQKEAAKRATESKAIWKSVTNEQWGSQKAAGWKAPLPDFSGDDAAELTGIDKAIVALEAQLGDANKRLGIAEHAIEQVKKYEATLAHLKETAKAFAYHADLVTRAEKDVAESKALLLDAQQRAGTKPVAAKTQLPCPECGAILTDSADGESLVKWEEPAKVAYDADAAAKVPALEKAIKTYETVLARHKVNLDAADEAAKQLKAIEDMAPEKPADPAPIRDTVTTLQAAIAAKRQRQTALQAAHAALDTAGVRTKTAKQHHVDVLEWSAIADALAPDGIPGELLAEALKPINDRLAQSAVDSGWKRVEISADMEITANGRRYRSESRSARWRVDAQIAEAISFLSGVRCMVLDEFDILDEAGRAEVREWLATLAHFGDIDSAIVLGTMPEIPSGLPDQFQAVWLEGGTIVERQREAEALLVERAKRMKP